MFSEKVFEFESDVAAGVVVVGDFTLRGQKYEIRALQDTAVAVLVRKTRGASNDIILRAILDFTEIALTEESSKRFAEVALNPATGLSFAEITKVFQYVLSVVGANPTGSASASSTPQSKTGPRSRAKRPSVESTP